MSLQAIASEYVGQKEIPGNAGFVDPLFQRAMQLVEWKKGQAWCAYFVRLCLRTAHDRGEVYADLVSPSAVATYNAYRKAGRAIRVPKPGSLAVWQNYKGMMPQATGHIGIVADPRPVAGSAVDVFWSIEGNTNEAGGREGDCVALKTRPLSFAKKTNGLVLLGFCDTEM